MSRSSSRRSRSVAVSDLDLTTAAAAQQKSPLRSSLLKRLSCRSPNAATDTTASSSAAPPNNNNNASPLMYNHQPPQPSGGVTSSTTSSKKMSSSFRLLRRNRRKNASANGSSQHHHRNSSSSNLSASATAPSNVMSWLELECPDDVLPKVLAFGGPQIASALNRTNRFWNALLQEESTWRVMCEELYKWNAQEREPDNWKEFYCRNPCVPVDYRSIERALELAKPRNNKHQPPQTKRCGSTSIMIDNNTNNTNEPQRRSIRVLLRPGRHYLQETITVRARIGVQITLETMTMPENIFVKPASSCCSADSSEQQVLAEQALSSEYSSSQNSGSSSLKLRLPRRRLLRGCSRGSSSHDDNEFYDETERSDTSAASSENDWLAALDHRKKLLPTRATLLFRASRKLNEPAICVRQGTIKLNNVEILHTSSGTDIWNGNAAIHVQPPMLDDEPVLVQPRPTVLLHKCRVSSRTGRGVVTIDGGYVRMDSSAILDCAATGLYVGGQDSEAWMTGSDVWGNGIGNTTVRRGGIARGHSGIYLEQGKVCIQNSNISDNVLTGISAVSHSNAVLELTQSDLTGNGTHQIEVPPIGSRSRNESTLDPNNRYERTSISGDNNNSGSSSAADSSKSGLVPAHWKSPVATPTAMHHHHHGAAAARPILFAPMAQT